MSVFETAYCRIFQKAFYVGCFFLPWREPKLLKGEGSFARLPEYLAESGLNNVLIITDKGLMSAGIPAPLLSELDRAGISYSLFDGVVPNPTIENIEESVRLYKENGCQGIIAIGGGSPMDCAKGCGARIACPGKSISRMKGQIKVGRKLPPLIAVPTTSGTGSEATVAAVVTDSATHRKYAINDPVLIPKAAVLDPLLTCKLPKHITSTTGMDALCHAVEAYIGHSNTRKTKRDAVEAVKLVFDNLYTAYTDGENLAARENMQKAAYLAGLAFTRAYVGGVHAVAHTLGGQYHIAHGLANAVIMPYVFRYYGKSAHRKLSRLADAVGIQGKSNAEKAEAFICAIEEMNRKMDIPTSFSEIKDEDIEQMVKYAYAEANPLYPTPRVLTKKDFRKIYKMIQAKH